MRVARYLLAGCARRAVGPPTLPGGRPPNGLFQAPERRGFSSARYPGPQVSRQLDGAVAHPKQPAHIEPYCVPEPAHLAVTALVEHHPEGRMAGVLVAPRIWVLGDA